MKVPNHVIDFLRRQSVEITVQSVREHVNRQGKTFVSLIEHQVYAVTTEGVLVRADVKEGQIGDFVDVTEEFGLREGDVQRDCQRIAGTYVEAVMSRNPVEAAQCMRELLGHV
jgi:hypothetical protein